MAYFKKSRTVVYWMSKNWPGSGRNNFLKFGKITDFQVEPCAGLKLCKYLLFFNLTKDVFPIGWDRRQILYIYMVHTLWLAPKGSQKGFFQIFVSRIDKLYGKLIMSNCQWRIPGIDRYCIHQCLAVK